METSRTPWDQLLPRDFLPAFHEHNYIIMACDINISFGKARQQLQREGGGLSRNCGMHSIWLTGGGIIL